jgi:hypothetical protein
MSNAAWAEVVSAIALVLLSAALILIRRRVWVVTAATVTYTRPAAQAGGTTPAASPETEADTATSTAPAPADGITVTLDKGAVVPAGDVQYLPAGSYRRSSSSVMRLLVIGADNRTSTSKTVAFAWTYAILFGLFAILVAKWLGDDIGYSSLISNGIREEYWLFLGGPYAAAIAAKYAATSQNQGAGKTPGPADGATVGQLVVNDEGNGDLGDFQYVMFNVVTLAFYLGEFLPHLDGGLPHIPSVLTGLALTSAGAYSAKKFLQQAPPTLTSLLPATAPASTADKPSTIEVWGTNLILPSSVAPGDSPLPPTVLVAGIVATVTASQETMGSDHLTVQVPAAVTSGPQVKVTGGTQVKVTAVRADGVPATGPGGSDGLGLTIAPQAQ